MPLRHVRHPKASYYLLEQFSIALRIVCLNCERAARNRREGCAYTSGFFAHTLPARAFLPDPWSQGGPGAPAVSLLSFPAVLYRNAHSIAVSLSRCAKCAKLYIYFPCKQKEIILYKSAHYAHLKKERPAPAVPLLF